MKQHLSWSEFTVSAVLAGGSGNTHIDVSNVCQAILMIRLFLFWWLFLLESFASFCSHWHHEKQFKEENVNTFMMKKILKEDIQKGAMWTVILKTWVSLGIYWSIVKVRSHISCGSLIPILWMGTIMSSHLMNGALWNFHKSQKNIFKLLGIPRRSFSSKLAMKPYVLKGYFYSFGYY